MYLLVLILNNILYVSSILKQEQQYDSFTQQCFADCLQQQQCSQYNCDPTDQDCLNSQNKFNNCFKNEKDCQEVAEQYQLNKRISDQVLVCMSNCTPADYESIQFFNNFQCQNGCLKQCADQNDQDRQYCQQQLQTGAEMSCFNFCHQRRNCEQFSCRQTDIYCLIAQQNNTNCSATIPACSNQYQAIQKCSVLPYEFQQCIDSCPVDPYYSQTFYQYQQCHRSCFILCKSQGSDIPRVDFGDYLSLCADHCQNDICKDYETTCTLQDFITDCQKGEQIYNTCLQNTIKSPSPSTASVIAAMESCENQVEKYLQLYLQKICLRKCFTNKCGMAVSMNNGIVISSIITLVTIILIYV